VKWEDFCDYFTSKSWTSTKNIFAGQRRLQLHLDFIQQIIKTICIPSTQLTFATMHRTVVFLEVAVTILGLAAQSDAFWRMECRASSGYARIDPLISYGGVAEHMHSVFGSGGKQRIPSHPGF
jgi:hypothetical protein